MPSDLESGSERENVLSVFHNHPELTLPGENIGLDEVLLDNPRHFIYKLSQEFKDPDEHTGLEKKYLKQPEIEIYRSDPYLDRQGILLEGLISYKGVLDTAYVNKEYSHIVKAIASSRAYIKNETSNSENHLAIVSIPENFDEEKLESSVDAAVKLLKSGVKLQERVLEAASSTL